MEVTCEGRLAATLQVIRAAFATVARESGLTQESAPSNAAYLTLDRLRADLNAGLRLFALIANGTTVGSVSLRAGREAGSAEMLRLAVLPDHRGRGYGRALVDHVVRLATADGARAVTIGIVADNTRLLAWYRACGFTPTGTRTFEHLPFTVMFLRRPLPAEESQASPATNASVTALIRARAWSRGTDGVPSPGWEP